MAKKLKIGIVVDQMLAGGVQLAAIEQVKELTALGHKARLLILMRRQYPRDFSYLLKGVAYQYLSDSYPSFFRNTIKFPIFNFLSTLHLASPIFAPFVVKKNDYDILVSWGTTTSLTTQSIFKKNKIPYLAIIHDPINYILDKVYSETNLRYFFPALKPIATFFEKSFVRDALETIIISKVHFAYLKKSYGVTPKIIHLGVNIPENIPTKRGSNLLSFGRWQKEKNPIFLLELAKVLPKARFVIAGSWIKKYDLSWFKRKVKEYSLEKRVKIVPYFSYKKLKDICKEARLWLYPHFEAFGLAALEAASLGLAIIIPEKSGVTEKFTHGVHGFFPKEISIKEYQKYMLILLGNERLAYKMGKAASDLVKKEFSWDQNVRNILKIIESKLSPRPKIVILELGHAPGATLAGGDKLMEPMAKILKDSFSFFILTTKLGEDHWKRAGFEKEVTSLPPNSFDESSHPIPVFLTYCIRMLQAVRILTLEKKTKIMYSSTNILSDVLPAFFSKSVDSFWIARIHHLIPAPLKREGRLIVNTVSYLMQAVALSMIKTRADLIIALNSQLKKELENQGFPKEKLHVLGAGIDLKRINFHKIHKKTKIFEGVYLGRLHPAKGIFDLVPIWKGVVKKIPNAKLAVIGPGHGLTVKELGNLIKKNGLTKNIKILGYLSDEKVYSLMKRAKTFLFTDHEAGWGIAAGEAMACGLPVVGYDIGILGNVFKKGFEKVQLAQTQEFSEKIVRLLSKESQRQKLASQARVEAKKLDWSKTTHKFELILDKLIGNEKDSGFDF